MLDISPIFHMRKAYKLPKMTQVVNDGARIDIQSIWTQKPVIFLIFSTQFFYLPNT